MYQTQAYIKRALAVQPTSAPSLRFDLSVDFGLSGANGPLGLLAYVIIIAQMRDFGVIDFTSFLTDFPWPTWIAAVSNLAMMLAAEHWFPWSFHLGYKLPRYWAFVAGCVAVIYSFGLWALMEQMLLPWLVFTAAILLLHWPGWRFQIIHRINYILAYIVTTLPVLLAFGGWALWAGEGAPIAGVVGFYIVGGVATVTFNILDKLGMSENFERFNHKR